MIYSLYDFLTNIGLLYLNHRPSEIFLYSSFTFFEYALFSYILYLLIKDRQFKKIIVITSISFSTFLIIYNFTVNVRGIDSIPIGIETILILIFSFYFLYEQMKDVSNLFIYNSHPFWIVVGMMIYLAGSFFIYIYASQLPTKEIAKYWIFTNIFSIIKNILFTIALIVNSKKYFKAKTQKNPLYTLN